MKTIVYIGNVLSKHGFTPTTIETLSPLLIQEGFKVTVASDKKNKLFRLFEMLAVIFKQRKVVDYVLIDTYSTTAFWYAYLIGLSCKCLKINYITILHGGNLLNRFHKSHYFSHVLFKNSFANVAPSKYFEMAFKARGYQQTLMIPNVLQISQYEFVLRESFSPKILWVRSLAEDYQPFFAIDVLVSLKKIYPNAQLTMVGPEKNITIHQLKKYAQRQEVEVVFTGKLSKSEWIALAKHHDIFLNTSKTDNTPVSVLEAMALGLPVVSSNVGGLSFLLNHQKNALLINDFCTKQFCEAISDIITNPQNTQTLVQNAKQTVEAFDWENIKELWIHLLSEKL